MPRWNQTHRCYCLCWTIVAYILKISEVRQNVSVFSMPYLGLLYFSHLKDARRTEVYVHTSRLREKILAAGSDLVSTHRGKEVVLVFSKDTGEALNITCNAESDMLQLFWCRKCSKGNLKQRKRWISSTSFKNINKFHTEWTVCDKAIRSQLS